MFRSGELFVIEESIPNYFELIPPKTLQTDNGNGNGLGDDCKGKGMLYLHIYYHPKDRPEIKRCKTNH